MHPAALISKLNNIVSVSGETDSVEITTATPNSREVTKGALFCAMKGARLDGHDFIPEAIAKGAAAILAEHKTDAIPPNFPLILVSDAYHAFGEVAEAISDAPANAFRTIAVTGTNGKTTTTYLLRAILKKAKYTTGMIGTVEYDMGVEPTLPADRTTPTPFQLQELFKRMKANHVDFNVMEISSHALAQGRLGHLKADAAIFTNLTQDHLDYHHTMEEYYQAKKILFVENLKQNAPVVINIDDAYGARLAQELQGGNIFSISAQNNPNASCKIDDLRLSANGTDFSLNFSDGEKWADLHTPLPGEYNAMNATEAIATAKALGISEKIIRTAIAECKGAPGRLQAVTLPESPFQIYIDYAHTDDALKNVLSLLKKLPHNRLTVVFGCGGDRDRTKRPKMAQAAALYADSIYVTSDNPRTESPEAIIQDILAGFPPTAKPVSIADRKAAIKAAIQNAQQGDIILVAGKGHEDYQEINGVKHHFNDAEACMKMIVSNI